MYNNLNKNISVWRGTNTPPTDYHVWVKDNGDIYIKVDEKWKVIAEVTNHDAINELKSNVDGLTLEVSNNSENIGKHSALLQKHSDSIENLTTRVSTNELNIAANQTSISLNSAAIESVTNTATTTQNTLANLKIVENSTKKDNIYKSYSLKSGDTKYGIDIDIPNDRFLADIKLGYNNATIDTSTGLINIGTGSGDPQYLLYSLIKSDNTYSLIKIDLTKFITEKEYSDGLEVADNKLKVKIDPSSEFISVSSDGIKVTGITDLVDKTKKDIEDALVWVAGQGNYSAVTLGCKGYGGIGNYSAAIGLKCDSSGELSLAAGNACKAMGDYSQAFGCATTARGDSAHAEGYLTRASESNAHAEGEMTCAEAQSSHAEGYRTAALGKFSHSEGLNTIAVANYSHAEGAYNWYNKDFIHMVGVGESLSKRHYNAHSILAVYNSDGTINSISRRNGYSYFLDIGNYKGQDVNFNTMKSLQEVISDINTNISSNTSDLVKAFTKVTLSASPKIIEKGVSTPINISIDCTYNGTTITPNKLYLESVNGGDLSTDTSLTSYTDNISAEEMYELNIQYKGTEFRAESAYVVAVDALYYCASGNTFDSTKIAVVNNKLTLKETPNSSYSGTFTKDQYLWLCVPLPMNITRVTSSGFDVPMDAALSKLINDVKYNCYRSTNSFNAGTVNFVIYGS